MDRMVIYILLAWNLECELRTYRKYNLTVGFSKYILNKKLLNDVTLSNVIGWVQVTLGVTQSNVTPSNSF